ncbi:hypothetical protein BDF19DRAFT_424587 [Syncephalis fuscata]|nr:hypothetical protein BDF19DRAFT_424587 [Syncephalis fuscata]
MGRSAKFRKRFSRKEKELRVLENECTTNISNKHYDGDSTGTDAVKAPTKQLITNSTTSTDGDVLMDSPFGRDITTTTSKQMKADLKDTAKSTSSKSIFKFGNKTKASISSGRVEKQSGKKGGVATQSVKRIDKKVANALRKDYVELLYGKK